MKKSKIFRTLAVAGACLCAPLVLSGCVQDNSSKVNFRIKDGYVQVTEDGKNWKNLIDIDDLKGEQGLPGENGVGIDGKEVEFQVADGWIQWKYTIDTEWTDLIQLEELKGKDGEDAIAPTITIGGNGNWVINGEDTGVKAEAVNGETGNGIQNITIDPNKSDASKTTYVITFTDCTTFEFEVYNGEDGEDAVAPTLQIGENGNWFINGEDTGVKAEAVNGETGNGIQNITINPNKSDASKTTYVITFTDNTTFEFEVYNGEDGEDAVAPTLQIGENGNWFINGEDTGVKAEAVNGETGNGIQNITINSNKSDASKTTYVITFTDGTTFEFEVYNGQDGKNAEAEEYTITYDYGAASEFFQTAPTSEKIKSTQWLTTLPSIKRDYIAGFKGWFIQETEKQIENYDFIGGDVTLEARFYINESSQAGLYNNGKMTKTWQQLVDDGTMPLSIDKTRIEGFVGDVTGELVVSNNIIAIGNSAFAGAYELREIIIPSSVISIGNWVFNMCPGLEKIIVDANNPKYDSREHCDAIIETATNELIVGCKNTIIPNGVTSIEYQAFAGCTSLTEITIPNSVTFIGAGAFLACTGLTTITIPNSVTTIETDAFKGCAGLTNVTIGSGVTSIVCSDFSGCTGLTSITVDSGNSVYRSEGNCLIRKSDNTLILGCKTSVIPSGVTSIGERAFSGCTGLTSIEISSSVTTIQSYVFNGCTGLTSIEIPNSVTFIGGFVFNGCTGLTSITVDSENDVYRSEGNCIISKSDNTVIVGCKTSVIPSSVTSIGDSAFYRCTGLTSIEIPSSVTTIERSAFNGCTGLTSIEISSSVTTIEAYAFNGCTNLKTIEIDSETIANSLTGVGSNDNGALLANATTIYIKSDLTISDSTYLLDNFTEQTTSDRAGYDKYVLNKN